MKIRTVILWPLCFVLPFACVWLGIAASKVGIPGWAFFLILLAFIAAAGYWFDRWVDKQ